MIPEEPEICLSAVNRSFLDMRYGNDYPVPGVLGIYALSEEQHQQLKMLTVDVVQYSRRLLTELRKDEDYLHEAAIGSRMKSEQVSLFRSQGTMEMPFLMRVDCLWDGERFWICEVNCDAVGGIEDAYFLHKVYSEHVELGDVKRRTPLAGIQLANYLIDYYGRNSKGIVVYTDAICRNAGGRLAHLLALQGLNVENVHLNDLEENMDGVRWIWRHLLLTDLFENESSGLVPAPRDQEVQYFLSCCGRKDIDVLSPISDRLLFDKRFLCKEVASKYVSEEVWNSFAKWVPESHLICDNDMGHDGIVPDGWVFKPARGFGGTGIRFAKDSVPRNEEAKRDTWIRQKLINCERIDVFSGQKNTESYYSVHGAHILAGEFIGDHLRVGPTKLARGSSGYLPVY